MSARAKTFSMRARLTFPLALAVLLAMGGAAKIVDWRADSEMLQRFDTSLLARARAQASMVYVRRGRIRVAPEDVPVAQFPGSTTASWYALRCGGRVIARTAAAPPESPAARTPAFSNVYLTGRRLRVVTMQFHPDQAGVGGARPADVTCTLDYALDREPLDGILHALDFILAGSAVGACLLVLLAALWLVRRGLRPLAVLVGAMTGIGPDAPGGRLPESDTTELAPLVTRFNEVLARMDAGLARERQFASGLAHEFRTRLAELRTLVDVETRYPSGRPVDAILDEVGNIGGELEATVTALLQLTRIQSGLEQPQPESVPLMPLLARVATRHHDAASTREVRIEREFHCDPAFAVEADPALLEIVLDNLLGNAVAYAPEGSTITLRAGRADVEVCNAAPALQADDLANFGQRFWRKGAQDARHAGLGLALAGVAARAMGMRLDFALRAGVLHATLVVKAG